MVSSNVPASDKRVGRGRGGRRRAGRLIAASVTAALTITGLAAIGSQSAGAATPPQAQSVGNFLDGMVGTQPIQNLVKLEDAHATAPGTTSAQNRLDVTALKSINLPLTGALQLPELFKTINVGAVNQVAVANKDGYSYGASGAVTNQGGVSVGGTSGMPAAATIKLGPGSLSGLLGGGNLGGIADSLGSITLTVGAVSALAQTKAGGATIAPSYNIAGLKLTIGSSALGDVLKPLTGTVGSLVDSLTKALGKVSGNPDAPTCSLTDDIGTLNLAGGAVVLDAASGGLTIDLQALLETLGLDLNHLPANTDLIDVLVNYLTSPDGLVKGLSSLLHSIIDPLGQCVIGLGPLSKLLGSLLDTVQSIGTEVTDTLSNVLGSLDGAASPLAPLSTVLKKLVDVGVNVQSGPGATATNAQFPFDSQLAATANQSTPVVKNQTLVRAIEINLVGDPLATIALANAASGPSTAAPGPGPSTTTPPASTSTPPGASTSTPPGENGGSNGGPGGQNGGPAGPNGGANGGIPTGVSAGLAAYGGSPTLPLVLVIVGLLLAGGGAAAWKFRGAHLH